MTPLLLLLSVICQAEVLTERYIVMPEQKTTSPNQSFSIKYGRYTLSDRASDITDTNGYSESGSPTDDKRQRACDYRTKTPPIESISWQWLCATDLLFAYELILPPRDGPLCATPYSWVPLQAVVTVSWLLKNYWNSDSPLFNPTEQLSLTDRQEMSQNQPFAGIILMPGSGQARASGQPSESSDRGAPKAISHLTVSFTSPTDFGSSGGNSGPLPHQHTLDINCFVHPCHGVCSFRLSFDSNEPAEWPLNYGQSSCPHLASGYCFSCMGHYAPLLNARSQPYPSLDLPDIQFQCNSREVSEPQPYGIDVNRDNSCHSVDRVPSESMRAGDPFTTDANRQKTCKVIVIWEDGQPRPCGKICRSAQILSVHKSRYHTGQKTCEVSVIGEDGKPRPCGKICRNGQVLTDHKRNEHSGQQTCGVTVIGKDGQQRPCRTTCKNAKALSNHKTRIHSRQKACDVNVVGEDGQQQPCGKLCQNNGDLINHKRNVHSGRRTCDVAVVEESGQLRPCGTVCKSAKSLSNHKRNVHSGQRTCQVTVVGEDGRQRSCGKVCKGVQALYNHKTRDHSKQKTCNITLAGEKAQQRPYGKICKNARALTDHKSSDHRGQQTCDVTLVGKDDQPRPCRKQCIDAQVLWDRKRAHRKRKSSDLDRNDNSSPQEGRVNKKRLI
ncbi:hypothetical protein [Endozoicomonas sp. SESOKO3]|uniref:hypothetical protein n=1 Tax=Endozoicomonas sp. SESOKO3 TaxID=2828744 RepID=UPI00214870BD|nr:hypothetical protein [Endozoicomonas sp. SESOKO3]